MALLSVSNYAIKSTVFSRKPWTRVRSPKKAGTLPFCHLYISPHWVQNDSVEVGPWPTQVA